MPEKVSISTNGQSRVVPPGFRFHPTEEELLQYYLRKKIRSKKIDLVVIEEVDFNELDPWDIQAKCEIGSTPQNDIGWYFFCRNDKKYPSGNRATTAGVWKATGRDKVIYGTGKVRTRIGMRKTLVYYGGRAPLFHRSDWIMYEYRLIDDRSSCDHETLEQLTEVGEIEEGWVVCRIFKKKQLLRGPNISPAIRQGFCTVSSHNTANNLQKTGMCQYPCSRGFCNDDDQGQGQIFQHMSTKQPNSNNNDEDDDEHNGTISDNIEKLPRLLNPGGTTNKDANYDDTNYNLNFSSDAVEMVEMETDGLCDWLSIDQLLAASHLNSDHEQQQPTLS